MAKGIVATGTVMLTARSLAGGFIHHFSTRRFFLSDHGIKCRLLSDLKTSKIPNPPSVAELHCDGLPLLCRAARYAKEGRKLLSEWPQSDGNVEVVSYHEVLQRASRISHWISSRLGQRETSQFLAHLTLPGSEYVACQWGAFGAGLASVPLAISQKVPELEHVLLDSQPCAVIVGDHSPPNKDDLYQAAANVGMLDRVVDVGDIISVGKEVNGPEDDDCDYWLGQDGAISSMDAPALLLYTSGTTGKPKGVVATHRNIYHQTTDLVSSWAWKETDVALHVLPLHHVHGVVNLLCCAAFAGARLEFRPFSAKDLWIHWAKTSSEKLPSPNIFMAVPTIYAKLLEAAETLPSQIVDDAVATRLKPMRLMVSGSAALPVSTLNKWKELTGHTLLERYGMTEFAMALSNPYQPVEERQPGHVGLPLPSVQVRLGDDGELQVKGPTVFERYLNRPDATKEAFTEDGFFLTGDVAEFNDETNSFRILGRASVDIIKTGGHKLSALEIERELLEHPDVAEVVIVGVPDEMWGERVGMICRLKPGADPLTLRSLRVWCEPRIARYKVPSLLLLLDEIPKNAMGKVNKKDLVKQFQ